MKKAIVIFSGCFVLLTTLIILLDRNVVSYTTPKYHFNSGVVANDIYHHICSRYGWHPQSINMQYLETPIYIQDEDSITIDSCNLMLAEALPINKHFPPQYAIGYCRLRQYQIFVYDSTTLKRLLVGGKHHRKFYEPPYVRSEIRTHMLETQTVSILSKDNKYRIIPDSILIINDINSYLMFSFMEQNGYW